MLVLVALSIVALMSIGALVVDYGVLWTARVDAQTAADAGALAGAIARSYDDQMNVTARTTNAVQAAVAANRIHGAAGTAEIFTDPSACPSFSPSSNGPCVRVDVYRDGGHLSTAIPTYLAGVFGVSSHGIKATATAQLQAANGVKCLKPWIVPDRFVGPHWPGTKFNPAVDTYRYPNEANPTGYGSADIGTVIALRSDTDTPSFYQNLSLSGFGPGVPGVVDAISGCTNKVYRIGDTVTPKPGNGGRRQMLTAMMAIVDQDIGASWDGTKIIGSCAPRCSCGASCSNGLNGAVSPRVVPVAIGYPGDIDPGRSSDITIVNIYSFFLLPSSDEDQINAVLVSTQGVQSTGVPGVDPIDPTRSFLRVPLLVR